jgi:hypothetical protein
VNHYERKEKYDLKNGDSAGEKYVSVEPGT